MAHMYETGWAFNTAAWHRLADIKTERPKTWDEARKTYLGWEPITKPVYDEDGKEIPGWKRVVRTDNDYVLTIQEDSYAVIGNAEFGSNIEYVMGIDLPGMPKFEYETLSVLRNGRIIAVSLWLPEPLKINRDDSKTYPFMNFWTRHDGQGGMKGGAGTFRVVCANTQLGSEAEMNAHGFTFTVRHTKNWADKMNEFRGRIALAIGNISTMEAVANELVSRRVDKSEVAGFVERWLPINPEWSNDRRMRAEKRRSAFWAAYNSDTCSSITGTAYGVQQAAVEVCDHAFASRSMEARAARQMLGGYSPKRKALALVAKKWL